MKLLYLDPECQYINQTASLLPLLMLSACPETQFYGPGYSSREELGQGLLRWVDAHGPFDAVMVGPWTPFFTLDRQERAASAQFVRRYTVNAGFAAGDLARYFDDVVGALGHVPARLKIVTSIATDIYASTQSQVDHVLEAGVVVLGPNRQFTRRLAEWPQELFTREKRYVRKRERLSDAWFEFLVAYPERVLTASHYVGEHEFCLTALESRRWDVAVPGVEYAHRRDALAALRSSGLRMAPKGYFHAFRLANRLGLPVYRHPQTARLYNSLFQRTLCTTRVVFTAPGGTGVLLRKFVEIPAAGAVLACVPCNSFEDMGFVDGVNYVQAAPADLARVAATLLQDAGLQRIATAGRELIMARHSMGVRATQIARCMEALLKGTYKDSFWRDGEFVVTEAVPVVA